MVYTFLFLHFSMFCFFQLVIFCMFVSGHHDFIPQAIGCESLCVLGHFEKNWLFTPPLNSTGWITRGQVQQVTEPEHSPHFREPWELRQSLEWVGTTTECVCGCVFVRISSVRCCHDFNLFYDHSCDSTRWHFKPSFNSDMNGNALKSVPASPKYVNNFYNVYFDRKRNTFLYKIILYYAEERNCFCHIFCFISMDIVLLLGVCALACLWAV